MSKLSSKYAAIAQSVECILGKDEVTGSNPVSSSKENDKFLQKLVIFSFIRLTASSIASQLYLSYDKCYSLREFIGE